MRAPETTCSSANGGLAVAVPRWSCPFGSGIPALCSLSSRSEGGGLVYSIWPKDRGEGSITSELPGWLLEDYLTFCLNRPDIPARELPTAYRMSTTLSAEGRLV